MLSHGKDGRNMIFSINRLIQSFVIVSSPAHSFGPVTFVSLNESSYIQLFTQPPNMSDVLAKGE